MKHSKLTMISLSLFLIIILCSCQPEFPTMVTFNTNGGTPVKSISLYDTNKLNLPEFTDIFYSKEDIYTPYELEQLNFKVNFDFEDEKLNMPTYKYNAWFDGWYTDKDLMNKFNADKKISDSITLYAKWIDVPTGYDMYNNLEFELSDDGLYYNVTKIKETSIPIIVIPSKFNDLPVKYVSGGSYLQSSILLFEDNSNIEYINENAFKGSMLEFVQLPKTLKELKTSAFEDCTMLQFVDFMCDGNLTTIGNYVFSNCIKLNNLILPANIESIGDEAFRDCINLSNIYYYDLCLSLYNIGKYAFESCSSLTKIYIPRNVDFLSEGIFYNCTSLERVFYYNQYGIDVNDKAFYGCESLQHIDVGAICQYIGEEAFANCTSLNSILLSVNVKDIGYNAFYNCINLNTLYTNTNDIGWYEYYLKYISTLEGETSPMYYVKQVYIREDNGTIRLYDENNIK